MKIAVLVARILLGLTFLVFGLNGFLDFLHMPMPPGPAGQYMGVLFVSHYLHAVFLVEVIGGVLLLSGQFIPLGLVLLGPVIFNILLFHTVCNGFVVHRFLWSTEGIRRHLRPEGAGLLVDVDELAPDSGIGHGIQHIGQQVDQHIGQPDGQDTALHQCVITIGNG
jgi:putative oxidoreductase